MKDEEAGVDALWQLRSEIYGTYGTGTLPEWASSQQRQLSGAWPHHQVFPSSLGGYSGPLEPGKVYQTTAGKVYQTTTQSPYPPTPTPVYTLQQWKNDVLREASNILGLMLQSSECRKEDKDVLAKEATETAEALLALLGKSKPEDPR